MRASGHSGGAARACSNAPTRATRRTTHDVSEAGGDGWVACSGPRWSGGGGGFITNAFAVITCTTNHLHNGDENNQAPRRAVGVLSLRED
jgi:hypothetical protein